jgi:hypothetical protein
MSGAYWRFMHTVEESKWFKVPVSILFYGSTISMVLLFFLSNEWFRLLLVYLGFWVIFFILYWLLFEKETIGHVFRDFINVIDDPIDELKEYLHCMPLPFGYQLNISFLMSNRKTTWDIIRKQGVYENCDPADLSIKK